MIEGWDFCEPLINRALKYQDTHTADDVLRHVLTAKAQLWRGKKSCAVTEICEYPKAKKLRVWLAAGDMEELLEMLVDIEEFAKAEKCTGVMVVGRPGWKRVLKEYKAPYTMLEKEISHE